MSSRVFFVFYMMCFFCFQVRAAALNFVAALAYESNSLHPGKHDFSEVVKAVVQSLVKDSRSDYLFYQLKVQHMLEI
jgi:hypothetical protein